MRFSLRSANSVRLLWVKKIQPGFNCGAVFDGDDKSTEKICALCTEKLRVRGRLSGIEPTSKIVGLLLPIGAVKAQPALGKGDKAGVVHGRERGTGGDAHVLRDGEGDAAPMARSFAVSWELQKPDTTSTVIPGCRARKLLRMPGIQLMQVLEQVLSFTRPEESPVRPRTTSANA